MRTDVLELVRDAGDLTHVVVLTYNLDFRFVQYLLRPVLRRCGHPSLTIFADARRAAESFARGGGQLGGLGVRYRVVGVPMPAGAAFHPKAVLLSGRERGTLLVGSGNLGFGGWRENGEIWLRRDSDRHGTATFAAFREYLRDFTDRVPLQDAITGEIEAAFDGATHPWAQAMEPPGGLLGRVGSGTSLLERMRAELAGRTITELTIAAPYFDERAAAVAASSAAFGQVPTKLLVPRRGNNFREAAAATLPTHVTLYSTAFTRGADPTMRRDVFLHAKFYALRSGSRVHLYVGSANASWAALMSSGEHGNAELLAHVELGAEEYHEQILQELTITAEPPELSGVSNDDDVEPSARLQILAARLAAGVLRVAFAATAGVTVTTCLLDGVEVRGFVARAPILELRVSGPPPRTVGLQGVLGGVTITSPLGWVDQEDALQVGSTARALAEEIRKTGGGTVIDVGAWTDVLAVFCQHLQVLPPPSAGGSHDGRPPAEADLTFTRGDVFSNEFELPSDEQFLTTPGFHGRGALLQQLMLRWFHGLQSGTQLEEDDTPCPAGDEPVDEERVPSPPPLPLPPPPVRQPSKAELWRFDRLVTRLQESMTDSEFLQRRPTSTLAADICLAAALLRTGLREQWINADRFFSVTHDIWRVLFLSAPGAPGSGAIEIRHMHAPDPAGFRRVLGAEQVTAALAAWAMTDLPPASAGPRHARFVLSALLSVARTEWLWTGGDLGVVARELGVFLRISGENRERVAQTWRALTRRGHALGRLEEVLRAQPLATWRARVTQQELACGELLWQDRAGWCITTEACRRVEGVNVPVLKLQGEDATTNFRAVFTVPIRDLVPPELAAPIAEIVADFGAPG